MRYYYLISAIFFSGSFAAPAEQQNDLHKSMLLKRQQFPWFPNQPRPAPQMNGGIDMKAYCKDFCAGQCAGVSYLLVLEDSA
jgi:hypothetical protein